MEWRFDRLMWKVFLGGGSCVYGGGEEREKRKEVERERGESDPATGGAEFRVRQEMGYLGRKVDP